MAEMMADGVEADIAFRNAERLEITQREMVDRVIKGSGFTRVREHGTSNPNKHKHNIRACFVYKKNKDTAKKTKTVTSAPQSLRGQSGKKALYFHLPTTSLKHAPS